VVNKEANRRIINQKKNRNQITNNKSFHLKNLRSLPLMMTALRCWRREHRRKNESNKKRIRKSIIRLQGAVEEDEEEEELEVAILHLSLRIIGTIKNMLKMQSKQAFLKQKKL